MINSFEKGFRHPEKENQSANKYERFYMPHIYEPDPEWARAMQGSVNNAVEYINENPDTSFEQLLSTLIDKAQAGLKDRAVMYPGEGEKATKIRHHAEAFGEQRKRSQRVTTIGERGPLSIFKAEAVESLKKFGTYSEEDAVWGVFSPNHGKPFKWNKYSLQHSYETPDGKVKLCKVESAWIPTHPEQDVREPFRAVNVTSPTVEAVAPMFKAANEVFEKIKKVKQTIDNDESARDKVNLKVISDDVAELYWILSQTWPYERGGAGVADLASKTIFDWLKIHTPLWKDTANPNIIALTEPLEEFQQKYQSMYQEPLEWDSTER